MPDFGPLAGLVGTAGSIVAAAAAITLAWRGRSKWEPSESDINNGPQRLGGLLTVVGIVVLWGVTRPASGVGALGGFALLLAVVAVITGLGYGFVISTQTYDDVKNGRKIIGGFQTTTDARREVRKRRITLQRYFAGVAYDPDKVWPRTSRALAKQLFVALYIVLIAAGSVALASAAIVVEKVTATPTPGPTSTPAPTPSPTPPPPTPQVGARTLHWVEQPGGTVLDGNTLEPGTDIHLEEKFPDTAPMEFVVTESPSLGGEQGGSVIDGMAALTLRFGVAVDQPFRANSDAAWRLPAPFTPGGQRTFTFSDTNPEGTTTSSASITSGLGSLRPSTDSTDCTVPNAQGGHVVESGRPGCVDLTVDVSRRARFHVRLLRPGVPGADGLEETILSWMDGLDGELARRAPGVEFDSETAFAEFRARNEAFLPAQLPDGWEVQLDRDSIDVEPGRPEAIRLTVDARSGGSAFFMIELRDVETSALVRSPLIPVTVSGNQAPAVRIIQPEGDLLEGDGVEATSWDPDRFEWYAVVDVVADASDPEQGSLAPEAINWTSDRGGVGVGDDLGNGDRIPARLYVPAGLSEVVHTVKVTVIDQDGATAVDSIQIRVYLYIIP